MLSKPPRQNPMQSKDIIRSKRRDHIVIPGLPYIDDEEEARPSKDAPRAASLEQKQIFDAHAQRHRADLNDVVAQMSLTSQTIKAGIQHSSYQYSDEYVSSNINPASCIPISTSEKSSIETQTPRIDKVLQMMRARLGLPLSTNSELGTDQNNIGNDSSINPTERVTKSIESAGRVVENSDAGYSLKDTADTPETSVSQTSSLQPIHMSLNMRHKVFVETVEEQEVVCTSDDEDYSYQEPCDIDVTNGSMSQDSPRMVGRVSDPVVLPVAQVILNNQSPTIVPPSEHAGLPLVSLQQSFALPLSFNTPVLMGLGSLARARVGSCPQAWWLSERTTDLQRRQLAREKRDATQKSELLGRLRSAVIANISIQHKQKGLARAVALLAPAASKASSWRFLSRRRQRATVQRLGKERLAALYDRYTRLRRAFAWLLMDAYSEYDAASEENQESAEDALPRDREPRSTTSAVAYDMQHDDRLQESAGFTYAEDRPVVDEHVPLTAAAAHTHYGQGWIYGTDESGNPYYYNMRTGQSSWEPPILSTADGQWVRQTDGENRDFWVNITSGQSHWEPPPEFYVIE